MSTDLVLSQKDKFEAAVKTAHSVDLFENTSAAFGAAMAIKGLREILTTELMNEVFMPLMNTRVGFMTDKNKAGSPCYSLDEVRNCLIDGICIGLLPTGNQINIIAGRMYPTKEGYTALLKKVGIKYVINVGQDASQSPTIAELKVRIDYEYKGEKNVFPFTAQLKKTDYTGIDQLKGKAERRAKKALFEYLIGCDLGDGDTSDMVDIKATVMETNLNTNTENKFNPEKLAAGKTTSESGAPIQQKLV